MGSRGRTSPARVRPPPKRGTAMTMLTALMMTITITMTVIMLPKMYHVYLVAEMLYLEEEYDLLRELLRERNDWVLRHVICGATGLVLLWLTKGFPGLEVPELLAATLALYAGLSLMLALFNSLLAQKVAALLSATPVRVRVRDQG